MCALTVDDLARSQSIVSHLLCALLFCRSSSAQISGVCATNSEHASTLNPSMKTWFTGCFGESECDIIHAVAFYETRACVAIATNIPQLLTVSEVRRVWAAILDAKGELRRGPMCSSRRAGNSDAADSHTYAKYAALIDIIIRHPSRPTFTPTVLIKIVSITSRSVGAYFSGINAQFDRVFHASRTREIMTHSTTTMAMDKYVEVMASETVRSARHGVFTLDPATQRSVDKLCSNWCKRWGVSGSSYWMLWRFQYGVFDAMLEFYESDGENSAAAIDTRKRKATEHAETRVLVHTQPIAAADAASVIVPAIISCPSLPVASHPIPAVEYVPPPVSDVDDITSWDAQLLMSPNADHMLGSRCVTPMALSHADNFLSFSISPSLVPVRSDDMLLDGMLLSDDNTHNDATPIGMWSSGMSFPDTTSADDDESFLPFGRAPTDAPALRPHVNGRRQFNEYHNSHDITPVMDATQQTLHGTSIQLFNTSITHIPASSLEHAVVQSLVWEYQRLARSDVVAMNEVRDIMVARLAYAAGIDVNTMVMHADDITYRGNTDCITTIAASLSNRLDALIGSSSSFDTSAPSSFGIDTARVNSLAEVVNRSFSWYRTIDLIPAVYTTDVARNAACSPSSIGLRFHEGRYSSICSNHTLTRRDIESSCIERL